MTSNQGIRNDFEKEFQSVYPPFNDEIIEWFLERTISKKEVEEVLDESEKDLESIDRARKPEEWNRTRGYNTAISDIKNKLLNK